MEPVADANAETKAKVETKTVSDDLQQIKTQLSAMQEDLKKGRVNCMCVIG